MKRLISILLVLMFTFALALPAMAETTPPEAKSFVVNNTTNRPYKAYQIFSGTQAEGEAMLGDVQWGVHVQQGTALMTALKAITLNDGTHPFAACETAANVADVLSDPNHAYQYNTPEALAFAKVMHDFVDDTNAIAISGEATSIELLPGYYLLKDASSSQDYMGLSLLQITGHEFTITAKTDSPTVVKKVMDEPGDKDTDSRDDVVSWGNTADHAINEPFQFAVQALIPADVNISLYDSYEVTFNDTMSAGITFDSIESVTINGADIPVATETDAGYQLTRSVDSETKVTSLTISISDIKPFLGASGTEVSASTAVYVTVIYNAHLNENAITATNHQNAGLDNSNNNQVSLTYSNNPNTDGTGTTAIDTVWVFTYKLEGTKYKNAIQDANKLEGAGFTLYTAEEYAKLDDSDDATVAVPVYLLKHADGMHYPVASTTENAVTMMLTGKDGQFNIKGLDVGSYVLVETQVPSGYNKCADIPITVTASHNEVNATSAVTNISMTQSGVSADDLKIDVINNAGASLPETGGMGTTVFYIVGAVLVLAAVVLMVTKKRMAAQE